MSQIVLSDQMLAGLDANFSELYGAIRSASNFPGFDGSGTTDSSAAIASAASSLGLSGGTVTLPAGAKVLIDANVTLPPNVCLRGPYAFVGTPGNNASAPYGNMGALAVHPARAITLSSGAGISGCLIYRKGMTFPAADSSLFAGIPIVAAGDDTFLSHSMILGFAQAFASAGRQRPRIDFLYHDNIAGIKISSCFDIPYVTNCHAWPFATIASGVAGLKDTRAGCAYYSLNGGDWNKFTNCFSWGYQNGFIVDGCNSATLLTCGADHLGGVAGAIGFSVLNASQDTRLIGCQAAAQDTGYSICTGAGLHTRMSSCDSWSCASRGVLPSGGDLSILGGMHRNTLHGVLVNTSSGVISIDGVRFQNNAVSDVGFNVPNSTTYLGKNDYSSFPPGVSPIANPSNWTVAQIPSAANLLLPGNGDTFDLTGNAAISAVFSGWAGRTVRLRATSAIQFTHAVGTPQSMRLSNNANLTLPQGGTLTIMHNGVQWFEIGRAA